MKVVILNLCGKAKILIVEHLRQHVAIYEIVVQKEIRQLGVLKPENSKEREEITNFVVQVKILAADIEKLLYCKQYK